ncbi:urease accessory protein [Chitinophaga costaii]|uniref:Urease accessory protein UreD n=1 Tax=Chitinophaga costaii TaxID=1335309 RepID=A0A1C4AQ63_9BACT|nr:urease accessory protein UreD [Chitinophaga costaii]PUZ26701.1 urease accessory protein UreD [Chitinophaga costaii]SCB96755.1 urease accessory protein [Chitinophaga costaii]
MICELHIEAGQREGKTYLQQAYCTRPFKVANIREDKTAPLLPLVIMSASPGMLEGDVYDWKITVHDGAQLQLQTQSYQRLFTMEQGAQQRIHVAVGAGAALHYLPHPTVPQAKSVFTGHTEIRLQANARLLWSEIVTCGRKLNGEIFAFTRYQNLTEVYWKNKLVLRDNLWLEPQRWPLSGMGQQEGFTHQASLFCFDEQADMNAHADALYHLFAADEQVAIGISRTAYHGLMLRILGEGGEQLKDKITRAAQLLADPKIVV